MTTTRPRLPWTALTALGTLIPACVLAGYLLGRWLDSLAGTKPWLALVGTALGAAAAFFEMTRMIHMTEPEDQGKKSSPPPRENS